MSISPLLPDVASEHLAEIANPLEWVGMEKNCYSHTDFSWRRTAAGGGESIIIRKS